MRAAHQCRHAAQPAQLLTLFDELRAADVDVALWWDDQAVRDYASVAKRIRHPAAGDLSFDIEIVSAPQDPDQRLVTYTAEPGELERRANAGLTGEPASGQTPAWATGGAFTVSPDP